MYSSKKHNKTGFATVKYIVFAVFLLLLSAGVAAGIFLKVSEITVEGASECLPEDIIKLSGIELGDSLMLIKENEAVLGIRNQLSVIKDIKIERQLPGKINIIVTENRAVAYVRLNESYYAVDSSCKILRKLSMPPLDLTLIKGVVPVNPAEGEKLSLGENGAVTLAYIAEFLTSAENLSAVGDISDADFSDMTNISFMYKGRFTVSFGKGENTDTKLRLVINAAAKLNEDDTGSINVVSDAEARFVPGQQGQ